MVVGGGTGIPFLIWGMFYCDLVRVGGGLELGVRKGIGYIANVLILNIQ